MSLHWSEEQYMAYQRQQGQAPVPAPQVSEKAWMAAVIRVAKEAGFLTFHTWSSKRSPAGFPDLACVKPGGGTLYLCELKTATGQVTKAQEAWLTALGQCTEVVAEVWRPEDWETIRMRLT